MSLRLYKKDNTKRNILIGIVIILALIILFFVISLINKEKNIAKVEISESNINQDEDKEEQENELLTVILDTSKIEEKQNKIPHLTDVGKEKMKNIYNSNEKVAYLTFDDGPSKNITPLILDILREQEVKATFFVLGSRAELYPDLVKKEYEEGHFIANHGYSHDYNKIYSSPQAVLEEYWKTEKCIKNALGIQEYNSYLFRFPGGSSGGKYANLKKEAIEILNENNILNINWNALTNDAVGTPTKESIMQSLIETVGEKNSVVILMHDSATKILTYECLPEIISYLKEKGYCFGTFYDIIQ